MIIGIAGVSRSGKTSLAHLLKEKLGDTQIISMDDYPAKIDNFHYIKDAIDWEHPSSLDFVKIIEQIKVASANFQYVIVEGIFIFYHEPLRFLMDTFIYLNLEKSHFIERKIDDNRWGSIPPWYREHIWKSHLLYGTQPSDVDFLQIDASTDYDYQQILDFIES